MRKKKPSLPRRLVDHFTMGVALGLAFTLLLTVIGKFGVMELVARSSAPWDTILIIVGANVLTFGVGATLTGWVFTMMEDEA